MLEKLLLIPLLFGMALLSGGLSIRAAMNLWPLDNYPIGAFVLMLGSGYICWILLKSVWMFLAVPEDGAPR